MEDEKQKKKLIKTKNKKKNIYFAGKFWWVFFLGKSIFPPKQTDSASPPLDKQENYPSK